MFKLQLVGGYMGIGILIDIGIVTDAAGEVCTRCKRPFVVGVEVAQVRQGKAEWRYHRDCLPKNFWPNRVLKRSLARAR